MQFAEILLESCRRRVLVAPDVGGVMNWRHRQELVRELVHGGSADSPANGLDHRGPIGVDWRIRDGAACKEGKADGALTAKAGHCAGFTRDSNGPPKSVV